MAYAKELVGAGLSSGTASAIGGQAASVAATGSTLATAAQVQASISIVTGADGNKGVFLSGQVGDEVWLFNNAGSTLKVYGDSSSVAICVPGTGLGTPGAAFSQLTYKTAIYKKQSSTQWFVNVSA